MILAFRLGPTASGRGLCDIERVFFIIAKSRVKKFWKALHEKNKPIIIQIEKLETKLLVYLPRTRTSQF